MRHLLGDSCVPTLRWPEKAYSWLTQVSLSLQVTLLGLMWCGLSRGPLWARWSSIQAEGSESSILTLIPATFSTAAFRGLCVLGEKVLVCPNDYILCVYMLLFKSMEGRRGSVAFWIETVTSGIAVQKFLTCLLFCLSKHMNMAKICQRHNFGFLKPDRGGITPECSLIRISFHKREIKHLFLCLVSVCFSAVFFSLVPFSAVFSFLWSLTFQFPRNCTYWTD